MTMPKLKKGTKRRGSRSEDTAILARRVHVTELYIQGKSQITISKMVGVCPATVGHDLQWAHENFLQGISETFEKRMNEEIAKVEYVAELAYNEFEQSQKKDVLVKGDPKSKDKKKQQDVVKVVRKEGNPEWLALMLKCRELKAKMWGLVKPETREYKTQNNLQVNSAEPFDWSRMFQPPIEADPIEMKLNEVRQLVEKPNEEQK